MRKLLLVCAALCLVGNLPTHAQTAASAVTQTVGVCDPTPFVHNCLKPDSFGNMPVTGSISTSIAGFHPASTGTPISVTTGGVSGTLPAGAVVVATNVGTTNGAYCKLGASSTTSDQYIAPNGGWFAFTISGETQLTCITSTSTTSVNMVGGTGIPTGTGGGGGGSGGSNAAAGATGSAVPSSASYNGVNVGGTLTGQTGTSGGNANDNIAQINGVTPLMGNGASGTGAQRVTIANDSTGTIIATQGTAANLKAQVSVASGGIASGGVASGAVASGAYASGAVASGAYAAGSLATGAGVDGWDVTEGTKADGVCGTATGTCSITALIKYLNSQVAAMPNTGGCGSLIPISQTSSTDLHTSSGKTYICSIILVVPDAEVVSLVEGTGSVCATGIAAVIGATTAANGMSLAANGGFSAVSSAPIFNTQTSNDHLCLLQSGSGRIAGFISYNDH